MNDDPGAFRGAMFTAVFIGFVLAALALLWIGI
jgi:hypothetical protein